MARIQWNHYLSTASVLILISLVWASPYLLRGARRPDLSNETQTLVVGESEVGILDEAAVLDPLISALAGARSLNPFSLQEEVAQRDIGALPLPPPPPLTMILAPMLPLVGEWEDE